MTITHCAPSQGAVITTHIYLTFSPSKRNQPAQIHLLAFSKAIHPLRPISPKHAYSLNATLMLFAHRFIINRVDEPFATSSSVFPTSLYIDEREHAWSTHQGWPWFVPFCGPFLVLTKPDRMVANQTQSHGDMLFASVKCIFHIRIIRNQKTITLQFAILYPFYGVVDV